MTTKNIVYDELCVNNNAELLSFEPMPTNVIIIEIITKTLSIIRVNTLTNIMRTNYFERVVPYNLWFDNKHYAIVPICENNQYIRTRTYKNETLTPLVSEHDFVLSQYVSRDMSLYQPFYPETFYAMWEFLQTKYLSDNFNRFLYVGREQRLGMLESLIFYQERYYSEYQKNYYAALVIDNTQLSYPLYLEQAYHINFITDPMLFESYDFIMVDCIQMFTDLFEWNTQERDFHSTLYYILSALKHLNVNGSMLVRINTISNTSWLHIIDILYRCFDEHIVFRPSVLNAFNSEVYIYVAKYNNNFVDHTGHRVLKALFRTRISDCMFVNINKIHSNNLVKKYDLTVKQWLETLAQTAALLKSPKPIAYSKLAAKWHQTNDLHQITDLTNNFDTNIVVCNLRCVNDKIQINAITPSSLYKKKKYATITAKRAELNYYKRVMDTKPSLLFADNRYNTNDTLLLNWETLSARIDTYQKLKYIIKKKFNGEMVTNAWLKMYEILNIYPDLLPNADSVKTFHLCEAPGAFIAATNHFLTTRGVQYNWYAQTLKPRSDETNPDAEHALDDYFGLIAKYPNQWLFGSDKDDSGDITRSSIIKAYAANPKLVDIDFMTADAGFKCDPADLNEQESYLGKINMGQVVCILACLPVGKSAVFKTFLPMTEPLTLSIMYLVSNLFAHVEIVKPATSHSSNSEVYVLLRKYKGIDANVLDLLYVMLDDPKITPKSLLFNTLDPGFFASYVDAVNQLVDRQIASLKRCYYFYYNYDVIHSIGPLITRCTTDWFKRNPMQVLKTRLR